MSRFDIRPHRPWLRVIESLFVILLLAGAGYLTYLTGRQSSIVEHNSAIAERERLQDLAAHLHEENAALRERLAILERGRQVEAKAYGEIESSLKRRQDENLALRQELAFYRGIVASSSTEQRLTIRSLEIVPEGDGGRTYRFEVVLTRLSKSDKVVGGRVSLILSGDVNGQQARKSLVQLTDRRTPEIEFRLMNFQRVDGQITLPPEFVPHHVLVKVVTGEEDSSERVERAFDWPRPVG